MTAPPDLKPVPEAASPPPPPQRSRSRLPAGAALAAGSVLLVVSPFLIWGEESGKFSAYARLNDGNLPGESFSGLEAAGGSWFGILVLLIGLAGLVAAAAYLLDAPWTAALRRRFRPELVMIMGVAAVVLALAYLLAQAPERAIAHSDGPGPLVALVGGVVLLAGAGLLAWSTRLEAVDDTPRAPVRLLLGVAVGIVILLVGVFSSWVYDERRQFGTDPETQAEIERLQEEGTAEAAAQATQLLSGGARGDILSYDAFEPEGPELGGLVVALGGLALALAIARWLLAGRLARHAKWMIDITILGVGTAIALLTIAWIASFIRVGEPLVVPGSGTMFVTIAGLLVAAAAAANIRHLRPMV